MNRRNTLKAGIIAFAGLFIASKGKASGRLLRNNSEQSDDFFNVIKTRRSVRKFKSDPVPREDIRKILDAARMAPTAGNQQPWKFLVIQDRKKLDELKKACIDKSIEGYKDREKPDAQELEKMTERTTQYFNDYLSAPTYIIVLTDDKSKYPTYNHHDGPLAAGYLMLAARALGYGTVFCTDSINEAITKEVFNIPDRYKRVCITPIGVPYEWPESPGKEDLDSFIVNEKF